MPLLEKLLSDPEMMAHLGGPESPEKIAERQVRYEAIEAKADSADSRVFKIVDESSGVGVGWVGYWRRLWQDETVFEIGWSVLPTVQGRGMAKAATAQALDVARTGEMLPLVHAFPSVDNTPSNAICRKLGFTLLGATEFEYPPGEYMTCNDWCLNLSRG